MTNQETKKVRFIDPPNILRQKMGYGGVDPLRLQGMEAYIDNNIVDFVPHAEVILARLDLALKDAQAGTIKGKEAIDKLTDPVMELKASGGMFKYMLVSEIANIILNFMENIDALDDDVFEVIKAHQNTLQVIIHSQLKGDGGREGAALAQALYEACRRYYKKHKIRPRG
ncbi:MAG: hypothetical protein CO093_06070 [Alphaproteobacteria bacterium CG_4_9_14_3_um_filter_47_13]|nr:MAG: hypothetical protein CO093_06070 [Alphaproteobacteria bacterium CG_4_9_14_3_um_filter_47_13]